MCRMIIASSLSFSEEPALRWIMLGLKFGPWRWECLRQWRALRSRGVKRSRAAMLAESLAGTFRTMCEQKQTCEVWNLNIGHGQCHVNGPVALLHRLGIVRAAKAHQPRALQLPSGKKWKQLCLSTDQLRKWIAIADDVGELGSPPRTCREWVDMHRRVHDSIVQHQAKGLSGRRSVESSERSHHSVRGEQTKLGRF